MAISVKNNPKIRILISGHIPPPMGGVGAYYQTLLNSSLSTLVDLKFVETSSQKRPLSKSGRWSFFNAFSALDDCFRFTKAVAEHHPEVTHIATAFGLSFIKHSFCVVIARLMGSKVLLHPHCSFATLYTNQSKLWQWFFKSIIGLTDGVVALSREWYQLKDIVPSCRVYDLPNGISLTPYLEISHKRLRKQSHLRILYLGYIGKAKGSFDLVLAAQQLITQGDLVIFDLVGGELQEGDIRKIKEQISEAGLEPFVMVHPPITGTEKLDLFQSADLFVYPSYHEGMPIAIIEAMASSLPVIATRVGGIPDLVKPNVNGLLIEPGCPDQLAEAIHKLVIAPDVRGSMQAKSLEIVQKNHDIENIVLQLVEIYKVLASQPIRW